ncbi:glutamate 5-kinase [Kyrpidia tusciae]|uniref:Glutamate 5-kinase n=1 Tax=Kyrpidia tusciae (strain DSM 2912 / NBRC 15312 / T2) TaxID=562970 RepID=D5WW49_KYRT2|nr:glutamate 5-kinase [Kyrpidia tusciae]ADG05681.1 glutamate 5-kinase [Kyrpidia tusciae DSM 2912]
MPGTVVVKIGSSSLMEGNHLHTGNMEAAADQLSALMKDGWKAVLVSSGAVAAGRMRLGLPAEGLTIPEKQAAAAVGQGVLMQAYERIFERRGIIIAQVLLTRDVMGERRRYVHARNTLMTLLHHRVLPIVNENDTVAVEEIRFGDNDALSAQVAVMVDADLLVLLTDTDGLYTADPRVDAGAVRIPRLVEITPQIWRAAGRTRSRVGTGGMRSKLQAARIASSTGIPTVIASARRPRAVLDAVEGKDGGTYVEPQPHIRGRKRWIAYSSAPRGRLIVDEGAVRALCRDGRSLLAPGLLDVQGSFSAGDVVSIVGPDGREIARGVVNYDARDLQNVRGLRSQDIREMGVAARKPEVVHRDDLVIMEEGWK